MGGNCRFREVKVLGAAAERFLRGDEVAGLPGEVGHNLRGGRSPARTLRPSRHGYRILKKTLQTRGLRCAFLVLAVPVAKGLNLFSQRRDLLFQFGICRLGNISSCLPGCFYLWRGWLEEARPLRFISRLFFLVGVCQNRFILPGVRHSLERESDLT